MRRLATCLVATVTLLAPGCNNAPLDTDTGETSDTGFDTDTQDTTPPTQCTDSTGNTAGRVRLVLLSRDVAAPCDADADTNTPDSLGCVDVYPTGQTTALNAETAVYSEAIRYGRELVPGTVGYSIFTADDDPTTATPRFQPEVIVGKAPYLTAVVWDLRSDTTITTTTVCDDDALPTTGMARVRAFNATPTSIAASLDVYVATQRIAAELAAGELSQPSEIAAGTDIVVGVDTDRDGTVDLSATTVLADGAIVDLFVVVPTSGPPPAVFQHDERSTRPRWLRLQP